MKIAISDKEYLIEPYRYNIKGFWFKRVSGLFTKVDTPLKQFLEEIQRPFIILSKKGCYLNAVMGDILGPFYLDTEEGTLDFSILRKEGEKFITREGRSIAISGLRKQVKRGYVIVYTQEC